MLEYLLFAIGFFLVIKGANFLVDGGSSLAKKLNISELIIGLTIVAFGTSMPELTVNLFSNVNKHADIAIGNILGANVLNILFTLGLCAIIFPLALTNRTIWIDIPLSFVAAAMVGILGNNLLLSKSSFLGLSRIDGLILLAFFLFFIYYILMYQKKDTANKGMVAVKRYNIFKSCAIIILGMIFLAVGGNLVVNGAVAIARFFKVSESLIALTIVSAGTTLPELSASLIATLKKNADIAVGNIVGSNIFNIFFILGVSSLIGPLPFTKVFNSNVIMTMFASIALFIAMFIGRKKTLNRWKGILFTLICFAYVVFLIKRG